MITIKELFDLDHTLARAYLEQFTYLGSYSEIV